MRFPFLISLLVFFQIYCFNSSKKENIKEKIVFQKNIKDIPCIKNIINQIGNIVDNIYYSGNKYYLISNSCIIDSLEEVLNPSSITYNGSINLDKEKIYIFSVHNRCGVGIHCEDYRFIKIKNDKIKSAELTKNYEENIIFNGNKILNKRVFSIDINKMIISVDVSLSETSTKYKGDLRFSFDSECRIKLDTVEALKLNGIKQWSFMMSDKVFRNNFNL